jgi:hypothetical protein
MGRRTQTVKLSGRGCTHYGLARGDHIRVEDNCSQGIKEDVHGVLCSAQAALLQQGAQLGRHLHAHAIFMSPGTRHNFV